MALTLAEGDSTFTQIVWGQLYPNSIAGHNPNEVFSHLSRHMGDYRVTALQLHAKSRIGQGFGHRAFNFDGFVFFNHKHSLNQAVLIPDTPSYHFVRLRPDQGRKEKNRDLGAIYHAAARHKE